MFWTVPNSKLFDNIIQYQLYKFTLIIILSSEHKLLEYNTLWKGSLDGFGQQMPTISTKNKNHLSLNTKKQRHMTYNGLHWHSQTKGQEYY